MMNIALMLDALGLGDGSVRGGLCRRWHEHHLGATMTVVLGLERSRVWTLQGKRIGDLAALHG